MAIARRVERNGDTGLGSGVTSFSEVIPEMARWPSANESRWLLFLLEGNASVPSSYVRSVILTDERFLHFQLRRDSKSCYAALTCSNTFKKSEVLLNA
jgi:hypothetical protein